MANPIQISTSMTRSEFESACVAAFKQLDETNGPAFVSANLANVIKGSDYRAEFMSRSTDTSSLFAQDKLQTLADSLYAQWKETRVVEPVEKQPKANNVCNKVLGLATATIVGLAAIYFATQR